MADPPTIDDLADRVPLTAVLSKIGKKARAAQALAARGRIPSAAKVGGTWTVEPKAIAEWLNRLKENTRRLRSRPAPVGSSAGGAGADARRYRAAYEQLMAGKRVLGTATGANGPRVTTPATRSPTPPAKR